MNARRLVFFVALDCAVMIIGNARTDPHFTFTMFSANAAAIGVAFSMPLLMALAGVPIARRWLRYAVTAVLWPIAAISLLIAAVSFCIATATRSLDSATVVPAGRYTLALFASDWGAMDEGLVTVDQVCRIVPGVMLSRDVSYSRGLDTPEIDVLDRDHVRIDGATVSLRPLLWPFC
jgi:hypothetical protein